MNISLRAVAQLIRRPIIAWLEFVGYQVTYRSPEIRTLTSPWPATVLHVAVLAELERSRTRNEVMFVQIGGFDGVHFDEVSSFALRFGWEGFICEPQTHAHALLSSRYAERAGIKCLKIAITKKNGMALLHRPKAHGESSPLASLNESHVKKFGDVADGPLESEEVETCTPASLIEHYSISRCDLLVVDTEGYDAEILGAWPWGTHLPLVVIFERIHLTRSDFVQTGELLRSKGFVLLEAGWDIVAIQTEVFEKFEMAT